MKIGKIMVKVYYLLLRSQRKNHNFRGNFEKGRR